LNDCPVEENNRSCQNTLLLGKIAKGVENIEEDMRTMNINMYGPPGSTNGGVAGEVRKNSMFRKIAVWIFSFGGLGTGGFVGIPKLIKFFERFVN